MRRAMEYVRWELDNWRTQRHGREMSIFTGAKKVAHYMWQSWKRGALLVLVLAFLPTLFPLVLFLSFVGFICAVPLLCGAATYYLFLRNFSLPLSIIEFIYPSNCPSEGHIAGSQSGIRHSVPLDVQEIESRQDEALLRTSAIGEGDTDVPRRASEAKAILVLEFELLGNERDEADNFEHQKMFKLNVPSGGNHESGIGSSSSVKCHPNAVFQVRGPIFLLPPAKLKSQDEQRKDEGTWSLHGTGDEFLAGAPKREAAIVVSTGDEPSKSGQLETQSKGVPCTPERRRMTETDWTSDASTDTGSSTGTSLGEAYRGYLTAEPVFSEHTATIAPAGESPETSGHSRWCAPDGQDCRGGNRTLSGNTEVMIEETPYSNMLVSFKPFEENGANVMHESTPELSSFISEKCIEASVKSTSTPFSYSALTISDDIARPDSESVIRTIRPKYWRDEVEDTVLSSAFANVACMDHLSSEASGDVASLKSSKCEFRKVITSGQDGVYLLECAREAEGFSASHTPDSGQYLKNMVEGENGRSSSSLRFESSLFTEKRRLSFSNALADDKLVNLGRFLPCDKFNDLTPDWKQRSVSTSFSSDYTWPSESSERGFEFLSTQGTACEEACVDTASSTGLYEESNLECGAVSDAILFPTPDQLTEDWETRRKRWEEESTLGRLVPLSPYVEAHSDEARSVCNPLFEFSTPAPPLKKLKTRDTNHIFKSPLLNTRFSKRHSAPPESPLTHASSSGSKPSPYPFRLQKRKSDIYAEPLDSDVFDLTNTNTGRHTRSYSTSFTEPFSGEFEDLLRYWRWRDKMSHSLTSISP